MKAWADSIAGVLLGGISRSMRVALFTRDAIAG